MKILWFYVNNVNYKDMCLTLKQNYIALLSRAESLHGGLKKSQSQYEYLKTKTLELSNGIHAENARLAAELVEAKSTIKALKNPYKSHLFKTIPEKVLIQDQMIETKDLDYCQVFHESDSWRLHVYSNLGKEHRFKFSDHHFAQYYYDFINEILKAKGIIQ